MSRLDELSREAGQKIGIGSIEVNASIVKNVFRPYVEALEAELSAEKAENAELAEALSGMVRIRLVAETLEDIRDEGLTEEYKELDAEYSAELRAARCYHAAQDALARRKARMERKKKESGKSQEES